MSSNTPSSRGLRRLAAPAKVAFTLIVLTLLVRFVGWRELLTALAATRTPWIIAMYAVTAVSFTTTAVSLWMLLKKTGVRIPLRRVLAVNALSNLYGLLAPGDLIAGLSKWAMLSAGTGRRAAVLSAVILNKMALALPLLTFGTLAFILQRPLTGRPVALAAIVLGVVTTAGAAWLLFPHREPLPMRTLQRAAASFPESLRTRTHSLLDSLSAVREFRTRDYLQVLSLCSLTVLVGFTGFACATRAAGLDIPLLTLPWIALILFIAKVLPITVSSIGVREGILIATLESHGVPAAESVAVGLILFSNSVFVALIGAAVQVLVSLRPVDPAHQELSKG